MYTSNCLHFYSQVKKEFEESFTGASHDLVEDSSYHDKTICKVS